MSTSFLNKDITVNTRRYLMFATDQQMRLLQKAKRLYRDVTFKVEKAPFTQLFSIHSFIPHGDSTKQVPLAYFLMSGKNKDDYKAGRGCYGFRGSYVAWVRFGFFRTKPFFPGQRIKLDKTPFFQIKLEKTGQNWKK